MADAAGTLKEATQEIEQVNSQVQQGGSGNTQVNQQDAAQELLGKVSEVKQSLAQANSQLQKGGDGNTQVNQQTAQALKEVQEAEQILHQLKKTPVAAQ